MHVKWRGNTIRAPTSICQIGPVCHILPRKRDRHKSAGTSHSARLPGWRFHRTAKHRLPSWVASQSATWPTTALDSSPIPTSCTCLMRLRADHAMLSEAQGIALRRTYRCRWPHEGYRDAQLKLKAHWCRLGPGFRAMHPGRCYESGRRTMATQAVAVQEPLCAGHRLRPNLWPRPVSLSSITSGCCS